jgi:hypothetical protein
MNAEFRDISKEAFIIAYKENFGNITIACESAGVGRGQYKAWCDKDPEFRQRLAEIEPEEIMLDFGEHKLMERIAKGDTLATMFLLKTKGKRRGYIERQEVAHEGDVVKQITVNVLKASHVEELSNGAPQLDGDENVIEDTGFVVPATEAANIQDIPLYEFDKEVDLPNEAGEYEE